MRLLVRCSLAMLLVSVADWAEAQANSELRVQLNEQAGAIEVLGLSKSDLESLERDALSSAEWSRLLEVKVARDPNGLPMLGHYLVAKDSILFTPAFPFDPGRDYAVRFRPAAIPGGGASLTAEEIVTVISLPAKKLTPTTYVEQIYPSGNVLPENQLKLYIHFSAPMSLGDGLPYVRLLEEGGDEVMDPFLPLGDAFWDPERRRYTVFFDPGRVKQGILPNETLGRPILDGNGYTLLIDATWRDAEGLGLRQAFRKQFRAGPADVKPLDLSDWTLNLPRAGTDEPLRVEFHEPLDQAILSRSMTIVSEQGSELDGHTSITNAESEWLFTPAEPWQAGNYRLRILSILEDLAGNRIGKAFEVDVFESRAQPEEQDFYELAFTVARSPTEPESPSRSWK